MNWSQFKDPLSHMCLAGAVVAPWFLTQEVAGSNPFTVMTNIIVTEFSETFRENSSDVFVVRLRRLKKVMESWNPQWIQGKRGLQHLCRVKKR